MTFAVVLPEILMRKIPYAMHFRGRTSLAAADSNSLRATGSAASCVMSTTIRHSGMESELKSSEGDLAFLDSNLRLTGPHSFQEEGTITFGGDSEHILRFSTLGEGHFSAGLEPGTMAGSASWNVEGGEGQFAAARGVITSAFTLSDSGELSDFHCGLIFLPE